MTYQRALRFYPPLRAAEKPELHEAVCRGYGCDDQMVLDTCYVMVRIKRLHDEFMEARRKPQFACECGNTEFRLADPKGPPAAKGEPVHLVCTRCGKPTEIRL